jgi:hypothetical protein
MSTPLPVIDDAFIITQQFNVTSEDQIHPPVIRMCVNSANTHETGNLSLLAHNFADDYQGSILAQQAAFITLGDTEILPLDGVTPGTTFTTSSAGDAGGVGSGTAQPNSMATLCTWQTGIRGRSYRGRNYFPGTTTSMVVNPHQRDLLADYVTDLQDACTAFLGSGPAWPEGAYLLQVLSIKLGTCSPVVAARVNPGLCEQRRRLEKVARH